MSDPALEAKREAQKAHFIRRAWERFGLKLTDGGYVRLMRRVTDNLPGTKYLGATPPDKTAWCIRPGGQPMRVIYDHTTDRLVTCLPYGERSEKEKDFTRDRRFKIRRLARGRFTPWK